MRHDPPTSEKAYDDSPVKELKKAQGMPGKPSSMGSVKAAAGAGEDEPHGLQGKGVFSKAAKHLADHSHSGIHKVV